MADLKDRIAALKPRAAGNPAAMLALARLMQKDGQEADALAQCRAALALAPRDAALAAQARALINGGVPRWHFTIVKDEARNAAYDAALRRVVKPTSRVLEIGTGTGLLAMMAGRAGAAEVVTCEMSPVVAERAVEIVAKNGYADRVRVVAKHSDQLTAEEIGGRADILVSEIVSNNMLGEDVLPAHERAVRDLLKPGAQVIPARGIVRVALAHSERDDERRLGVIDGFDLSSFEALMQPVRQLKAGEDSLALRSEPADLFVFNFASGHYCAPAQTSAVCRSKGGRVNGIVQWIALELDDVIRYENRPAAGVRSCWAVLFYRLPEPIDTQPGTEVRIFGSHDRHRLTIWPEAMARPNGHGATMGDRS